MTSLPEGVWVPCQYAEIGYGMARRGRPWARAAAGEVASSEAIRTHWGPRAAQRLLVYEPRRAGAKVVLGRLDQHFGRMREALIERCPG